MDYFKDFYKIKYYIIALLLVFGIYAWAGFRGVRVWGDDLDTKETHNAVGTGGRGSGVHGFYHK